MSDLGAKREQRKQSRAKKRLQVRFGPGDLAHAGYTQDVSESGVCLQAEALYPPRTILNVRVDYPEGAFTRRGVVRWSREYPPAVKRNARGVMGVEFLEGAPAGRGEEEVRHAEPAPPPRPPRVPPGVPAEMNDQDLDRRPARRRQISTLLGYTFEVRETEHRGAIYIRIFRLPLTDGSHEAVFRGAFWSREEADAAVRAFLRTQ